MKPNVNVGTRIERFPGTAQATVSRRDHDSNDRSNWSRASWPRAGWFARVGLTSFSVEYFFVTSATPSRGPRGYPPSLWNSGTNTVAAESKR